MINLNSCEFCAMSPTCALADEVDVCSEHQLMTRREYNLSQGITRLLDAGCLEEPVDEDWIEFIEVIIK